MLGLDLMAHDHHEGQLRVSSLKRNACAVTAPNIWLPILFAEPMNSKDTSTSMLWQQKA